MNLKEYTWSADIRSDGRVTIPKFIRTTWNLQPGDVVHLTIQKQSNSPVTMNNIIV